MDPDPVLFRLNVAGGPGVLPCSVISFFFRVAMT